MAYTLISSQTLGSTAASVTFSSIPQTYKDLVLRISAKDSTAGRNGTMLVYTNTTTGTNNSFTQLFGNAGSASATSANATRTFNQFPNMEAGSGLTATASFCDTEVYIPNYTVASNRQSSSFGTVSDSTANGYILAVASLSNQATAVTSLIIVANTLYLANSSFYLYGIN